METSHRESHSKETTSFFPIYSTMDDTQADSFPGLDDGLLPILPADRRKQRRYDNDEMAAINMFKDQYRATKSAEERTDMYIKKLLPAILGVWKQKGTVPTTDDKLLVFRTDPQFHAPRPHSQNRSPPWPKSGSRVHPHPKDELPCQKTPCQSMSIRPGDLPPCAK